MGQYNNDFKLEQSEGCLEKLKVVVFLAKHISLMYLCEQ